MVTGNEGLSLYTKAFSLCASKPTCCPGEPIAGKVVRDGLFPDPVRSGARQGRGNPRGRASRIGSSARPTETAMNVKTASVLPLGGLETGPRERGRDEEIYRSLYTAIVEHHLAPGARLPEDALAESFGISRTGIRKVLQRLAHERLIELAPNRGATVAQPSVQEAREVFAARRIVECAALTEIGREPPPVAALDELKRIVAAETDAQARGDKREAIHLSGLFHLRVLALADNRPLSDFLGQLVSRTSLVIAMYGTPLAAGCNRCRHEQLIELLAAGDTAAAARWMDEHLREIEAGCAFAESEPQATDLKRIFAEIAKRPRSEV